VHNTGTLLAPFHREILAVVEQRVDHRAGPVSDGGMDDHPSGLVEHQQIFVLEKQIQGQILWRGVMGGRSRFLDAEFLASLELKSGLGGRRSVEKYGSEADPLLQLGPRALRETGAQKLVETRPGFL
jgi:hypothetical protein